MTVNDLKEQFLIEFEKYFGIIHKISRAYTKTTQDREDLINDITLELWKAFPHFKGDSNISTWIYRIALNVSMNSKRRKRIKQISFSDTKHFAVRDWLSETDENSQTDFLYECIDELNEFNKAIIILYLDSNSHEEISAITGISKTNVGTRISRIKDQIKHIAISKK